MRKHGITDGHHQAVGGTAWTGLGAADVADLLELVAAANSSLLTELDAITGSRRSLSQATVNRLEQLLTQLRPAARVRQVLADLDPQMLLAGAREWQRRRSETGGGQR